MKTLKNFKKYFITKNNRITLYDKINNDVFISIYVDGSGLINRPERWDFDDYFPMENVFISHNEYQLIIDGKITVNDLYNKYLN